MKSKWIAPGIILLLTSLSGGLAACEHTANAAGHFTIETVGSMHATLMDGERDAKIELASLADKQGLYAVGPIAGLSGEITFIDSIPTLASIGPDGAVQLRTSFHTGAPFLVWAEVSSWREEELPRDVRSIADLEAFLTQRAAEEGLGEAFPFLLEGEAANVGFHVLNADPETPNAAGMQAHKEIEAHFKAGRSGVSLVGFYSTTHQGVFVHRGALTHIHFINADGRQSGHVESVDFGEGRFVLSLPG